MPRPGRRTRGAPPAKAKAPTAAQETETTTEAETRGRTRNSRSNMKGLTANESTALRMADLSRDAALERLANDDPTTTENDDNDAASVGAGPRGRAMATPLRAVDASGLDLADDVFGNLDDSFGLDDSVLQGNQTMDSSTMSLRNIGRQRSRSRNSTIIGRNEAPIRPSSRSGTTPLMSSSFNIGVFRRRKREPSILGTGRKPRYDTTGSVTGSIAGSAAGSAAGSVAGSLAGSDAGSDREITPEAESTPLNERRRSRRSMAKDVEVPATQTPPRATRKRKSGDDMDVSERPEKTSRVAQDEDAVSESDSELSSIDSPLSLPRPMQDRPTTPSPENEEDIPPPASSDSEDDGGDIFPDIHALARRRRRASTPPDHGQLSDVSSPPSLTHSPNYRSSKRGKAAPKRQSSPQYSTADLANLLPKRRARREEPDEAVDTSGLARDDDELHMDARSTRRRRGHAGTATASDEKALKPRQIPAATTATTRSASRAAKTYSRRLSDKENETGAGHDEEDEEEAEDEDGPSQFAALPDDTFGETTVEGVQFVETEELKAAAKKFKEVDKYELAYEEVTEPSSPMQDAR